MSLGAQNVHQAEKGAFTGEVSAMLDKLDVKYVIVGHSERRELFGETDEVVNAKATAVLHTGMTPIVCENTEERTEGRAQVRATEQLGGSLAGPGPDTVEDIVIVMSRSGRSAPGRRPRRATRRDVPTSDLGSRDLRRESGRVGAYSIRRFGKARNASELMAQPDIDGALVGGASLDAEDFARIVKYRIYQA